MFLNSAQRNQKEALSIILQVILGPELTYCEALSYLHYSATQKLFTKLYCY